MGTYFRKLLILLFFPCCLWATTTVTGTIQNLGTNNVGTGAFVRFWLRGCGGNIPRVNGTAVIAPSQGGVYFFDFAASSSGVISGTLYSTRDSTGLLAGDIECGGSKLAVWYGMQVFLAGKGGAEIPVHAKSGSTLDITQVTPITTNPVVTAPTGDSTYLRLDAGNSPLTGNLSSTGTISDTGGTHTGTETFTGPIICKILENIQCVDSTLSRGGLDIGNEINLAYAALPSGGGEIYVAQGSYNYSTAIAINTSGKQAKVHGAGAANTTLNYTGSSGVAFTLDTGNLTGTVSVIEDLTIATTVGGTTATGLSVGPTNGAKQSSINRVWVTGFKVDIRDTSLFSSYTHVFVTCPNTAGSSGFQFAAPGDDAKWYGGALAGCAILADATASTNGPLTFYGTDLFGGNGNTTAWVAGNNTNIWFYGGHLVNNSGTPAPSFFNLASNYQLSFVGTIFEDDRTTGAATSIGQASTGVLNMTNMLAGTSGATYTEVVALSGSAVGNFFGNNISSSQFATWWNTGYTGGSVRDIGTTGVTTPVDVAPALLRAQTLIADKGSVCTNGELALSGGWQSTGSATVTAVAGNGQTCSWTITTGTTTGANPTVTDTLTNALPAATTVCEMNIHGGTHTPAAGEGFQQTTLSATAPVFTFNGTPTASGTTYFITRRCGP